MGVATLPPPVPATTPTLIQGSVFNADGRPANGRVVISWPFFQVPGQDFVGGETTFEIANGELAISLQSNQDAQPLGMYYTATFELDSGQVYEEYWIVPSKNSVTMGQCRVSIPGEPSVIISPLQLGSLGAQQNMFLQWNGTRWVPGFASSLNFFPVTIGLLVGSTGSNVNVVGSPASLGSSLTLNIPDASPAARGVVTTGAQAFAGDKTFSGTTTVANLVITGSVTSAVGFPVTWSYGGPINGIVIGQRPIVNFYPGSSNVAINMVDDPAHNQMLIEIDATGGGGGGMIDPTLALGDLIVRGPAAVERLPRGTEGQILMVVSTSVSPAGVGWSPLTAVQTPWLSDINAASHRLENVSALGIGMATTFPLAVHTATDRNWEVVNSSDVAGGITFHLVNDANTANIPLEVRAFPTIFDTSGSTIPIYVFSAVYATPRVMIVHGDNTTGGGSTGPLVLVNPNANVVGNMATVLFATMATDGNIYGNAQIGGQFMTHGAGYSQTDLVFSTGVGGGPVERMRITAGGNVGIATYNPQVLLDVNGTGRMGMLQVMTDANGQFRATSYSGLTRLQSGYAGAGELCLQREVPWGGGSYDVGVYDGSGSRYVLFQGASRYVGIETSTPSGPLHVVGQQANGWSVYIDPLATNGATVPGIIFGQHNSVAAIQSFAAGPLALCPDGGSVGVGTLNPLGNFYVHVTSGVNFWIWGPVSVGGAVSINATNDANTVNIPLEIRANHTAFPLGNVSIGTAAMQNTLTVQGRSTFGLASEPFAVQLSFNTSVPVTYVGATNGGDFIVSDAGGSWLMTVAQNGSGISARGNCNITGQYLVNGVPISGGPTNFAYGNRALNTVYQNSTGKAVFVTVTIYFTQLNQAATAYCDGGNPPGTVVARNATSDSGWATTWAFSFIVLPGYYYNVSAPGNLVSWSEWY